MDDPVTQLLPETARLRPRNQLTLPERVVAQLNVRAGDRFLIAVDGPDSLRLVRIRDSYAGALSGMWGTTGVEIDDWLRNERESWRHRQARYEDEPEDGVEPR